jgi:hypothetical protein
MKLEMENTILTNVDLPICFKQGNQLKNIVLVFFFLVSFFAQVAHASFCAHHQPHLETQESQDHHHHGEDHESEFEFHSHGDHDTSSNASNHCRFHCCSHLASHFSFRYFD